MRTLLVAVLFTVVTVVSGEAAPLTGGFSIVGNFVPVPFGLANATAIDFVNCNGPACVPGVSGQMPTPGVAGEFLVTGATGDFTPVLGQVGQVKDFTFLGAGSANYPNVPINAFEVVSLVSFDLNTVSVVNQSQTCGPGGVPCLELSGSGVFHAPGFDPTPGSWSFSGLLACHAISCPPGFIETFVFSSNYSVPTPEPSVMLLLGIGLVVVGTWGRAWIGK